MEQQLDFHNAPQDQKESYDFFWRITKVSVAAITAIMLFLFFAFVSGNMAVGLLMLAFGFIVSGYFLVRV